MGLHVTAQRLVSRPRSSELQEIEARTRNWRLVWPAPKSRRFGSLYEHERQSSDVSKTTTLSWVNWETKKSTKSAVKGLATMKGSVASDSPILSCLRGKERNLFFAWVTGGYRCDFLAPKANHKHDPAIIAVRLDYHRLWPSKSLTPLHFNFGLYSKVELERLTSS